MSWRKYGGHCILLQKLFAIVVPEAIRSEVLRTEAGVSGRDEVFHPQTVYPLAGKLRLAEGEPGVKDSEML